MRIPDRRLEPRVLSQGTGEVTTDTGTKRNATIIDVSRSGVQIELDHPIAQAATIELQLSRMTVRGSVEHCRLHSNGRYRVGILTAQVSEIASS
jgi:hypothetical protein